MGNYKKVINAVVLTTSLLVLCNCATIAGGTKQNLHVESSPSEANLYLNGTYKMKTPGEIIINRSEPEVALRFAKEGFVPLEYQLAKGNSRWFGMNILLGGLPGMLIDMASGAAYEFKPGDVIVNLDRYEKSEAVKGEYGELK